MIKYSPTTTYRSKLEGMAHLKSSRRWVRGLAAGGKEVSPVCTLLSAKSSATALFLCVLQLNHTLLQSPAPDAPAHQPDLGVALKSPPESFCLADKGSLTV